MTRPRHVALGVGLVLAASNLLASSLLGLGDAEALYYCYGRHLQLAYLDHPPLIGWLIGLTTWLGGSSVLAVRVVPLAGTLLALLFTYRLAGELFGPRAAGWSALLLLATPVFSIGMTAATPDAPLVALWAAFGWQLQRALSDERSGLWPRLGRPALLGLLLGLAFLAKYTGACLAITALLLLVHPRWRSWLRRPGCWIGGALAAAVASPVLLWNLEHGWAGALHRLVWTQQGAGITLRNLGALVGGQLLYAGPLVLVLLAWAGGWIWRQRAAAPERLLLLAAAVPALALTYLLVAWSAVAEPHWPAPAYLPLLVAGAGLVAEGSARVQRLARWAVGYGVVVLVLLQLLVLTPILPWLAGASYEPRYDLANELRGWPQVAETLRRIDPARRPVVGAFYTQCAQLAFALAEPDDPPVRCASPEVDDFDIWQGPLEIDARGALFVTDNRFEHDPARILPGFGPRGAPIAVEVRRGGRGVRRFEIHELVQRPAAASGF